MKQSIGLNPLDLFTGVPAHCTEVHAHSRSYDLTTYVDIFPHRTLVP